MINKAKLEYHKVYGENHYLGKGGLFLIILRNDNYKVISINTFSNMISAGIPRKIIINQNFQEPDLVGE